MMLMILTGCDDTTAVGSQIAEKEHRRVMQYQLPNDEKQRSETIRDRLNAKSDIKAGKFKPESNPGRRK